MGLQANAGITRRNCSKANLFWEIVLNVLFKMLYTEFLFMSKICLFNYFRKIMKFRTQYHNPESKFKSSLRSVSKGRKVSKFRRGAGAG